MISSLTLGGGDQEEPCLREVFARTAPQFSYRMRSRGVPEAS